MSAWPLAFADAVSLIAFTLVGLHTHRVMLTAMTMLRDLSAFWGAWFGVALVSGLYQRPGWKRFLGHWVVAVPLGVVLRAVWLGQSLGRGTLIFGLVALSFTLLFVATGRAVAMLLWRRGDAR